MDVSGHEACSGCGICTMSCPVWWETRDVWFTPHGRARALQGGAGVEELADSVLSCRMCGACEPACPEELDIMTLVRTLRTRLTEMGRNPLAHRPVSPARASAGSAPAPSGGRWLLAGPVLEKRPELLETVIESLGGTHRVHVAPDDGRDVAWALEAGVPLEEDRLEDFLKGLDAAGELIVIEGILHQALRERRPGLRLRGLAETLLDGDTVSSRLGPRDLLVIDPRAYHADHPRLVRRFTELRSRTRCQINLDLQRLAIPAAGAAAMTWMFEGRDVERVVVESPLDLDSLTAWTDIPVVHLSSLVAA